MNDAETRDSTGWGDEFAGDAELSAPTGAEIAEAVRLAFEQIRLEDEVADIEKQLKAKKAELDEIAVKRLPLALLEASLASLPLSNGMTVTVKNSTFGGITEENRPVAHAWLRENGHGDIIKVEVKVGFGRGAEGVATQLYDRLKQTFSDPKKVSVGKSETVAYQTLGAFVRQQIELGAELPEAITVTTIDRAVVARPKQAERDF